MGHFNGINKHNPDHTLVAWWGGQRAQISVVSTFLCITNWNVNKLYPIEPEADLILYLGESCWDPKYS